MHRSVDEMRDGLKNAVELFISCIGEAEWNARREKVIDEVEAAVLGRPAGAGLIPIRSQADAIVWYLHLAISYLDSPLSFEYAQGSRVLAPMHRIGTYSEEIRNIKGAISRCERLMQGERNNPDQTLFELLIAILYLQNGYHVEFIEEGPDKTPDICVALEGNSLLVECKRMQKSSDYSMNERSEWDRIWPSAGKLLLSKGGDYNVIVTFHEQLKDIETSEVHDILDRFPLETVNAPIYYSDNRITLQVQPFAQPMPAKIPAIEMYTPAVFFRLIDRFDPQIGYRIGLATFTAGDTSTIRGGYIVEWNCDNDVAIETKARLITRHLSKAVEQFPTGQKCAIHVGIESMDGDRVEKLRFERIGDKMRTFEAKNKDIQCVYCHLMRGGVSPNLELYMDETVSWYELNPGSALPHRMLLGGGEMETLEGTLWG